MNTKKATKRALLTSVTALVMCVVMLVGTTFAWFTDTASTGVNKIQAGNLDIDLEYKKTAAGDFIKADENTPVFNNDALWEPGHVEYVVLKISNAGTLALKYKLGINIAGEKTSTNIYNNELKLSDHIKFAVLKGDKTTEEGFDRDTLVAAAAAADNHVLNAGYTDEDHLVPKGKENASLSDASEKIVTLVVWMPTTVGNEANYRGEKAPSIDLGINVVATQDTVESDSFDETYDANATYPVVVSQSELNSTLTLADLKDANGNISPVEVTLGTVDVTDINYEQNNSGYKGKGVMLGSTNLNQYGASVPAAGEYKFTFKDGTIESAATGYSREPVGTDNRVFMLVPGNSDVVFENMTFKGVVNFDIQMYTSPWSYLNSITFKNCTFEGIIVGSCPANKAIFDGCTFNDYTNTEKANNSNPIWWRAATGYWGEGADESVHSLQEFTFINNKVTGTRPVKIERIGWNCEAKITFMNNEFDISAQDSDGAEKKNMAINIGQKDSTSKFTLIDEGNTISSSTAALYTASLTSGSNQYIAVSGNKVLDGSGNPKVITAMVWKTTTGETFEMKSVD